jgi:hypothetical protein
MYNCLLFNEWFKNNTFEVYKSRRHYDGRLCFDGEWFVVVAILPTGQITNHYHIDYWDYFRIPSYYKVKDEFDGHSSQDVLDRLKGVVDMDEIVYVKDLIKYLADFNPNAKIKDTLNIGWSSNDGEESIESMEISKLNATEIELCCRNSEKEL